MKVLYSQEAKGSLLKGLCTVVPGMKHAEASSCATHITAGEQHVETPMFEFDHEPFKGEIWLPVGVTMPLNFNEFVQPTKLLKHPVYLALTDAENLLLPDMRCMLRVSVNLGGNLKWLLYRWSDMNVDSDGALIVNIGKGSPDSALPVMVFEPLKHYLSRYTPPGCD